jgi:hypothetical protein
MQEVVTRMISLGRGSSAAGLLFSGLGGNMGVMQNQGAGYRLAQSTNETLAEREV